MIDTTKKPEKFESTAEAMKAGALKPILTPSLRAGIATQLLAAEVMHQGLQSVVLRTEGQTVARTPLALAITMADELARQAGYAVPS